MHSLLVRWRGYTLQKEERGLWVTDRGDSVPQYKTEEWSDRVVMLWIHGIFIKSHKQAVDSVRDLHIHLFTRTRPLSRDLIDLQERES